MVKFKDLEIISAIAELRSITRAAVKLDMYQSNVSTCLSNIESQYNVKIFKRHRGKVELTQLGMQLLPVVEECLKNKEVLLSILDHHKNISSGTVVIYAKKHLLRYLTKNIIHKINNTGGISITLKSYDALDFSFPEDCDLLISHDPRIGQSVVIKKIVSYDFSAFAVSSSFDKFTAGDGSVNIILNPLTESFKDIISENFNGRLIWKYYCEDFISSVNLATKGLGVLIAPEGFFQAGLKNIIFFKSQNNILNFNSGVFIIYKRQKLQPMQVRHIINELSNVLEKSLLNFYYHI